MEATECLTDDNIIYIYNATTIFMIFKVSNSVDISFLTLHGNYSSGLLRTLCSIKFFREHR